MNFTIGKTSLREIGLEMLKYLCDANTDNSLHLASHNHAPQRTPNTDWKPNSKMPTVDKKSIAAAAEYEQNTELMARDILLLRQWLLTQRHLPEIKDEMLKVFHHSCYFDIEKTKECIEAYYTIRSNTPEMFRDRDVRRPEIAKSLEVVNLAILPVLDPHGNRLIYCGLRDFDVSKFRYPEANKIAFMTMDSWLETNGSDPGIILIQDMNGSKLGHLAKFSLSLMRKVLQYHQEANPIRLVAVHVTNSVPWVDKALAMLRPFMKKELFQLIHFHKGDNETLYDYIPKECLPSDFGGPLDSVNALSDENAKRLDSFRENFKKNEKIVVDESKRDKKKKNKKDVSQDIMFEKLDID